MDNIFNKCGKMAILLSLQGVPYSNETPKGLYLKELVRDGYVEITDISRSDVVIHKDVCLLTPVGKKVVEGIMLMYDSLVAINDFNKVEALKRN